MRTHSIVALLGLSALGAGCVIVEPGPDPQPQPPREFESFRIDWGFGEVPPGADQSGSIQLDADGTLRLDTPCMAGICDDLPDGSYETVVLPADLDAAVAVLRDPDLVQLLALERTVCTPVEDVDETMSLAVTGGSYSNQTVLCEDGPIVAARAVLNQLVERYFVGTQPPPPPGVPVLVSAGWSFGFCAGQCVGNLTRDGAGLHYVITGHQPEDPVYLDNAGTLTIAGQEALEALSAGLAGVRLEERYGCPDCADGGASQVTFAREGGTSTHTYEFNNPPAVLADVDAWIDSVMAALETCSANEYVDIAADCTPRTAD